MEHSRFPRSILGQVFAEGFVAGLMEEQSALPDLLETLAREGISAEDVRVLPGEWALRMDTSHHPSLATEPPAAGEDEASQYFMAGALLGDVLVGVRAGSDQKVSELSSVLEAAGITRLYRFGQTAVRRSPELAGSAA